MRGTDVVKYPNMKAGRDVSRLEAVFRYEEFPFSFESGSIQ
jgi:hypothetical protein